MPALNRNQKVKCGDCGNMYVGAHVARHRKRCAKGVVSCPDCKYSTYNQPEKNYILAKKDAQPKSKQSTFCSSWEQQFPSFYSLRQHRRKEHGAKQRKRSDTVADLNKIVEEEGDKDLDSHTSRYFTEFISNLVMILKTLEEFL